jgi:hypothetical protein
MQEDKEVEAGVRRNACSYRGRKRTDHVVAQRDDGLGSHADATVRNSVDDGSRVVDLTQYGTVRAARFGDDAHRPMGGVERRHDGCEAIAVGARDRDHNARVDATHHRARDVANEIAVGNARGAAASVDDDSVARVFEDECGRALREGGGGGGSAAL